MESIRDKRIFAPVALAALVSGALAFRDLGRRTDSQVRGPKTLWRVLIVANAGNSAAYWIFGRKK